MVSKGVYPYEYMDNWQKFEETSLPPKYTFYSWLNMKGFGDQDYNMHSKFGISWRKIPLAAITIPT